MWFLSNLDCLNILYVIISKAIIKTCIIFKLFFIYLSSSCNVTKASTHISVWKRPPCGSVEPGCQMFLRGIRNVWNKSPIHSEPPPAQSCICLITATLNSAKVNTKSQQTCWLPCFLLICLFLYQEKISKLYERKLHGDFDTNSHIQMKKEFRNPRYAARLNNAAQQESTLTHKLSMSPTPLGLFSRKKTKQERWFYLNSKCMLVFTGNCLI